MNSPKPCSYVAKPELEPALCLQGPGCGPPRSPKPSLLFLLRFQLLEKLLDCERFVEFCHQKLPRKSKVFPKKITCWRWWGRKELEGLFPVPNLEKGLLKQIYVHSPAIRIREKRRFCSLLPPQNLEQGLARSALKNPLLNE